MLLRMHSRLLLLLGMPTMIKKILIIIRCTANSVPMNTHPTMGDSTVINVLPLLEQAARGAGRATRRASYNLPTGNIAINAACKLGIINKRDIPHGQMWDTHQDRSHCSGNDNTLLMAVHTCVHLSGA